MALFSFLPPVQFVARAALVLSVIAGASRGSAAAQPSPLDRALGGANWAEAVRLLDSALSASPRDAVRYQQRGRALRELQQYDRSLADYTKAISIDSRATCPPRWPTSRTPADWA